MTRADFERLIRESVDAARERADVASIFQPLTEREIDELVESLWREQERQKVVKP